MSDDLPVKSGRQNKYVFSEVIEQGIATIQRGINKDIIIIRPDGHKQYIADAVRAIIEGACDEAVRTATSKKLHLKKNDAQAFCGWGTESGQEFVEIIEDATCKTCIRLAKKI